MAEVAAPREIETKYAVERSFTVPPLAAAVPGIAAVDQPRTVELTASYYDTADLRLARDGITLRRRTGGDDAGWHLKLPDPKDADVRFEIGAPLGVAETGQDLAVPESLADLVAVRLRGELAALPVEQALGPVSARFDAELYGGLLRAREAALTALRGERYRALVDSLVGFAAQVPTTAAATEPADAVLRALVRRSWRSLARRVQAAVAADPQHDELYHRARKAAKRTRYAAEACIPAYGSAAAELATRVAAVQDALGEHQDSVIARELLRTLAVHANAANENAYTYGLLAGREWCAAHTSRTEFSSVWRGASRRRYRRWLADR